MVDQYRSVLVQHPPPSSSPDLLHSFHKQSAIIQHVAAPSQSRFAYAVNDHLSGDIKSQEESRYGDGSVEGSYSVVDPDGYRRTVHYTADRYSGFKAIIQRKPLHSASSATTSSNIIAPLTTTTKTSTKDIPLHTVDSYTPFNSGISKHYYHHRNHHQQPTSYQTISLPTSLLSTNDYQNTFINHSPLIHHQQSELQQLQPYSNQHSLSVTEIGLPSHWTAIINYGAPVQD